MKSRVLDFDAVEIGMVEQRPSRFARDCDLSIKIVGFLYKSGTFALHFEEFKNEGP